MESEDLDGAKDQWLLVPAILPVKRERERTINGFSGSTHTSFTYHGHFPCEAGQVSSTEVALRVAMRIVTVILILQQNTINRITHIPTMLPTHSLNEPCSQMSHSGRPVAGSWSSSLDAAQRQLLDYCYCCSSWQWRERSQCVGTRAGLLRGAAVCEDGFD